MPTPDETLAAIRRHIEQAYREVGTAAFAPGRFETAGAGPEVATAALFRLVEDGLLAERQRLTCPNGHSWEAKGGGGQRITCPSCRETFPADDVFVRVVFRLSRVGEELIDRAGEDSGKGDASPEEDQRSGEPVVTHEGIVLAGSAADLERLRVLAMTTFANTKITIEPVSEPGPWQQAASLGRWVGDHLVTVVGALFAVVAAVFTAIGAAFGFDFAAATKFAETIRRLFEG